MSIKLTSKKAKIIEIIFLFFLITSILITFFRPINTTLGKVSINAKPLDIGDRDFYINIIDPLSKDRNPGYDHKAGPLYPEILRGISFISIKLFKQSSTSIFWNSIVISIASILTFLNMRFTYPSEKILFDETAGIITMIFFTICPYTYFYALSGGITIYTLFGTTICTYLVLKINYYKNKLKDKNNININILKIFLLPILIYMSLLRPSSAIFSFVFSLIMMIYEINNILNLKVKKKLSAFFIFVFVISIIIAINQLFLTKNYSIAALNAFSIEQGTFLGYEREFLRNKITILLQSSDFIKNVEGVIYSFLWKSNDFFTGIIDLRDTHSQFDAPLLSFLIRISAGTILLAPLTYFFLVGVFIFRKYIINSGLVISLVASIVSISPSLIGVAMSRYYYMFFTPFILISAMTISKIYKHRTINKFE